ncbi:beta-glucanosyltransferase, partial [Ascosphaera pollenicola]
VYEYSQESSNYGLVEISNTTVKELSDFTRLKEAFQNTAPPTGTGGYNSTGGANPCPAKSDNWEVDPDADLPSTPSKAVQFMESGPAEPSGFSGGSQTAGEDGGSSLTAGSGPTITASTTEATGSSESSSGVKSSGAAGAVKSFRRCFS